MTNHMHIVCRASGDAQLSDIIRDFKKYVSQRIIAEIVNSNQESRREWILRLLKYHAKFNSPNTTYQLWKSDNHPVELHSNKIIWRKINYTHQNPVVAAYVHEAEHYLYSSASNYLKLPSILEDVVLFDYGVFDS